MAIFTSIGAAIFGAGTFMAGITTAALQTVAGIAVSLIGKAMQGEPEPPRFGVQGKLQAGEDVPRSINLGWNCTAGSLVYHNTFGDGGTMSVRVIALGDLPIRQLRSIIVDGVERGLQTTDPHPDFGYQVNGYYHNGTRYLWVKFYDGAQTTADPFLVSEFGSDPDRPYGADRVGFGVPYVIVYARAPERQDEGDKPLFQGIPSLKFPTYGVRWYNIAQDSTAGGSGTQRWDNPATWGGDAYDFNPIVQLYNIMRGVRYDGQWLYGAQAIAPVRLPAANWIAAINAAQASIAGPSGSEPTYRAGGEVQVGAQVATTVEALLTAANARLVEVGGTYKVYVGPPGPPVMAFTDADILSTEEQSFSPFFALADTVNGVDATYPNPAEGWNVKKAPPLHRPDLEVLDGNRRLMASVSLDLVPYHGQVQRLMKWSLAEALRARRHTFVLGPEFRVLEPGDVVQWTSARNGYVGKLFRVDGIAYKSNLDVIVDLTEVDPSDYDWNQAVDYAPVVDGPLQLVGPKPMPMQGWQVFPAEIKDDQGRSRQPGIEVWAAPGVPSVTNVRVQVRVGDENGPLVFDSDSIPYADPWKWPLDRVFPANTPYVVRGIFIGPPSATWSGWLAVTTPNIAFTEDDLSPALRQLLEDTHTFLNEDLPSIEGDIDDLEQARQGILDQLNQINAELAEITGAQEWDVGTAYDDGDLVIWNEGLYRAIDAVPAGVAPSDTDYWEKIGDYASLGQAVAALTVRLDAVDQTIEQHDKGFTATAEDSRKLHTALMADALFDLDAAGAAIGESADQLKANASVAEYARTEISRVDGTLTIHAEQFVAVQAQLVGKVDTVTFQQLSSTVTEHDGLLTAQGSLIEGVQTELAGKASAEALGVLEGRVDETELGINASATDHRRLSAALMADALFGLGDTALQISDATDQRWATAEVDRQSRASVTDLQGEITAVAQELVVVQAQISDTVATAISGLTTTVTQQGDTLVSQGQAITSLSNAINDPEDGLATKASASAMSALQNTVSEHDGEIQANAQAIDALDVILGTGSSSVILKGEAAAAPAGFTARYAIRLQTADGNGIVGQATLFIDIRADGTSRIGLSADNTVFFLADGTPIALFDENGDFRNPTGTVRISMLQSGGGGFSFG